MRRALAFVIPFLVVVLIGVGAIFLPGRVGLWGPPQPVDIGFDDLTADPPPFVRISGMAHFEAVMRQEVPATLVADAKVYYVYGLFPPYDTDSRRIELLVRTEEPPERLVHYELVTLEGWLGPLETHKVPLNTEYILSRGTSYFFSPDVLLLEPVRKLPFDREAWEADQGR